MFINFLSLNTHQLSAELINWLNPENKFLQLELDDIVKSLAFPMEIITERRWKEILHKTTMDRQKLLYGKTGGAFSIEKWNIFSFFPGNVYKYAQSIAAQLSSHLLYRIRGVSREYKNVTLP